VVVVGVVVVVVVVVVGAAGVFVPQDAAMGINKSAMRSLEGI
jgi:hypothetical protein